MNTKTFPVALTLAAALFFATGITTPSARAQDDDDLSKRVAELERTVVELRRDNEAALRMADEATKYLRARAQNAEEMLAGVDECESLGFTKGINFQSREVLLAGFRTYWAGAKTDLPKVAPRPVAGPADKAAVRQVR